MADYSTLLNQFFSQSFCTSLNQQPKSCPRGKTCESPLSRDPSLRCSSSVSSHALKYTIYQKRLASPNYVIDIYPRFLLWDQNVSFPTAQVYLLKWFVALAAAPCCSFSSLSYLSEESLVLFCVVCKYLVTIFRIRNPVRNKGKPYASRALVVIDICCSNDLTPGLGITSELTTLQLQGSSRRGSLERP